MINPRCEEILVGKIKKTSKEYVFITHAAECNILAIKKKASQLVY